MIRGKRISAFAFFLFLQFAVTTQVMPQDINHLIPETSLRLTESKLAFKCKYDMLCLAIKIYKLDAVERNSPSALKEMLDKAACVKFLEASGIRFDFDKLNIGKKGWTRYYPFEVGAQSYVIRIFRTDEKFYQPEVSVLFEGEIKDPAVTFQVLPSLNDILADCKIAPKKHDYSRPPALVCP